MDHVPRVYLHCARRFDEVALLCARARAERHDLQRNEDVQVNSQGAKFSRYEPSKLSGMLVGENRIVCSSTRALAAPSLPPPDNFPRICSPHFTFNSPSNPVSHPVSHTRSHQPHCLVRHHNATSPSQHICCLSDPLPPKEIRRDHHTFLLSACNLFFFVCALIHVPITNDMMLKNGTQVCSGRNFCANASARGDVTQLTFMTGMKPARTVARTWWKVRAPAMMAMEAR